MLKLTQNILRLFTLCIMLCITSSTFYSATAPLHSPDWTKVQNIVQQESIPSPTLFSVHCHRETPELMFEQQVVLSHFSHVGVTVIHAFNGDRGGLPLGSSLDAYMSQILTANFVILFLTPNFKKNSELIGTGAYNEVNHIMHRIKNSSDNTGFLIPIIQEGSPETSLPHGLSRLCTFIPDTRRDFVQQALDECFNIVCHRIYQDSSAIRQLYRTPIIKLVPPTPTTKDSCGKPPLTILSAPPSGRKPLNEDEHPCHRHERVGTNNSKTPTRWDSCFEPLQGGSGNSTRTDPILLPTKQNSASDGGSARNSQTPSSRDSYSNPLQGESISSILLPPPAVRSSANNSQTSWDSCFTPLQGHNSQTSQATYTSQNINQQNEQDSSSSLESFLARRLSLKPESSSSLESCLARGVSQEGGEYKNGFRVIG